MDLTGQTYGRLHIDSFAYKLNGYNYYNCTCECGNKKILLGSNVKRGLTLSCGCLRNERIHESHFEDKTGKKYNKLKCISWERRNKSIYWKCKCDCGNITWVKANNLHSGAVKSCGCAGEHNNIIHGMSHTRLHNIWSKMVERCERPNSKAYKWYGAENKHICEEWQGTDGFIRFKDWAYQSGYDDSLTIERKDVKKGYSPDNCCWIPFKLQARNRRNTRKYIINGEEKLLVDLVEEYQLDYKIVWARLNYGWTIEEALGLKLRERSEKRNCN